MKNSTVLSISILALSLAVLTGCQVGKLQKPAFVDNLAFWNKESKLDKDYIEPPSAMFTPTKTNTAVAKKSDRPPTRPDSGSGNDVGELNRQVADAYRKLSSPSETATNDHRGSETPISQVSGKIENAVTSNRNAAFNATLPQAPPTNTPFVSEDSSANHGITSRTSNRKQPDSSIPNLQQVSNQSAEGPLMPLAGKPETSNSKILPKTTYAKTAAVDLTGDSARISNPYTQSQSPVTDAANVKVADTNQSATRNQILNPYFPKKQETAGSPQSNITTGSESNRLANQEIPETKMTPESALIATAPPSQSPEGNSTTNPNSMISVEIGTANNQQVSYNGYPITPHKPFLPRKVIPESSSSKSPVRVASLPASLLRGQGTYAPGSVKAPDAILPGKIPGDSGSNQ